jgi:hypothetical protein
MKIPRCIIHIFITIHNAHKLDRHKTLLTLYPSVGCMGHLKNLLTKVNEFILEVFLLIE